jgi:hypothetical protein
MTQMLSLLSKAQAPLTSENSAVVTLVREMLPRLTWFVDHWKGKAQSSKPQYQSEPLLVKIPALDPLSPPIYVSTTRPVPQNQLKGKRRVPSFVVDAAGFPFLRIGKPESHILGVGIRRAKAMRTAQTTMLQDLQQDELPFARQEDEWESQVADLRKASGDVFQGGEEAEPTYVDSITETIAYVRRQQHISTQDSMARASALLRIVEMETVFAEIESILAKRAERLNKTDKLARPPRTSEENSLLFPIDSSA